MEQMVRKLFSGFLILLQYRYSSQVCNLHSLHLYLFYVTPKCQSALLPRDCFRIMNLVCSTNRVTFLVLTQSVDQI